MIHNAGPVPWRMTCIYGEAQLRERHITYDTMRNLVGTCNGPWVVIGDLNEALVASEHQGVNQRRKN